MQYFTFCFLHSFMFFVGSIAVNATMYSRFYNGTQANFLMDDVQCVGSESNIAQCRHNGWGNDNCGYTEVAGVVCSTICKCYHAHFIMV